MKISAALFALAVPAVAATGLRRQTQGVDKKDVDAERRDAWVRGLGVFTDIFGVLRSGCGNKGYCDRMYTVTISDPSAATTTAGTLTFECDDNWDENGLTKITYDLTGLTAGLHGLHVHAAKVGTGGDTTCASTGGHWNPLEVDHGSNLDLQRHIGDLGNIEADATGAAKGEILAYVPLRGDYGIEDLAVVVHAGEDDLGTGGNDGSRAVGNAGARPGCGNIVCSADC